MPPPPRPPPPKVPQKPKSSGFPLFPLLVAAAAAFLGYYFFTARPAAPVAPPVITREPVPSDAILDTYQPTFPPELVPATGPRPIPTTSAYPSADLAHCKPKISPEYEKIFQRVPKPLLYQPWACSSKTLCRNLTISRYGAPDLNAPFPIDFHVSELLAFTRAHFRNAHLTRVAPLLTGAELEITAVLPAATGYRVLEDGERWIWEAKQLGFLTEIDLGGGQIATIEALSLEPKLFRVRNFLKDHECKAIMDRTGSSLVQSKVGGTVETAKVDPRRTSWQAWFGDLSNNNFDELKDVQARVERLTLVPRETYESVQVVRYRAEGQEHYYAHHDYIFTDDFPSNPYYNGGGNRFLTFLFYIGAPTSGGATSFPFVNATTREILKEQYPSVGCDTGLQVVPVQGEAVLFYDLVPDLHMFGVGDRASLHSGCDVTGGEKWIANQWVRTQRIGGMLYDKHY